MQGILYCAVASGQALVLADVGVSSSFDSFSFVLVPMAYPVIKQLVIKLLQLLFYHTAVY